MNTFIEVDKLSIANAFFSLGLRITPTLRFNTYTIVTEEWLRERLLPSLDYNISQLGVTYSHPTPSILNNYDPRDGKFVCQQFSKLASVLSHLCNLKDKETVSPLAVGEIYYVPEESYNLSSMGEGHCINWIGVQDNERPGEIKIMFFDAQPKASIENLSPETIALINDVQS